MSEDTTLPAENQTQTSEVGAPIDYGQYNGAGFENQTTNDIAIPFLSLLQSNSPQVIEGDPEFVEGAKAGDLMNSVTNELYGSEVHLIPCYTEELYKEWVPRDQGGGLAGIHSMDSDIVDAAKAAATNALDLKTEAGNNLRQTFDMYCLLLDGADETASVTPIMVSFSVTKIKVYKAMNLRLKTAKGNPPMFAFRLKISSKGEKSKRNEPYKNFVVDFVNGSPTESLIDPNGPQAGLLAEGFALIEAVKKGIAQADHSSSGGEAPGAAEEPEMF